MKVSSPDCISNFSNVDELYLMILSVNKSGCSWHSGVISQCVGFVCSILHTSQVANQARAYPTFPISD